MPRYVLPQPTGGDSGPVGSGLGWIEVPPGKLASWSLVLDSQGIRHHVGQSAAGYGLVLAPADLGAARRALEAFEAENEGRGRSATSPRALGRPAFGLSVALLVLLAFLLAPPDTVATAPFVRGAAEAGAIRQGELWRVATALTLHADLVHLVSNLAALGLLAAVLAAVVGEGVAAALLLLSGTAGNWLNALLQPAWHQSVGASTSVFGAVGALVGVRWRQLSASGGAGYPLWAPLLAGLLLLALFGANPHSDVSAHVLGFFAGLVGGLVVGGHTSSFGQRGLQIWLAVAVAMALAGAWWWALGQPGVH